MGKVIQKTSANQLAYSAVVSSAYEVHGTRIAEKATEVLFRGKKKRKGVDLVAVTQGIAMVLKDAEADLEGTASAHADELADDDPLREERDEAAIDLGAGFLSARSIITGVFGVTFAKRVGLDVRVEERPDLMKKIGASVIRLLRKTKKPAASFAGSKVDLGSVADELDVKVVRLAGLLSSLKREEREAQQTMIARDQAAAHWNLVVTLAGNWLEGLARIAGEHEIADRVRPTERRRIGIPDELVVAEGDTEEEETEVETEESDTDATDTDATDTDAS